MINSFRDRLGAAGTCTEAHGKGQASQLGSGAGGEHGGKDLGIGTGSHGSLSPSTIEKLGPKVPG